MEKAKIANISRHRLSDGKGITTLVAFQGCMLHCRYCLNPNAIDFMGDASEFTCMSLYEAVKIDDLYFKATGGGITFGGGEPLLYSSFIREFKEVCEADWQLNLETSLNVPRNKVEEIISVIDEYFIDIKDMNANIYEQYTGKGNENVIENLEWMVGQGLADKMVIRVPTIPDFNGVVDIENSLAILKSLGMSRVDRFTYINK